MLSSPAQLDSPYAIEIEGLSKTFTTWWGRQTPSLVDVEMRVRRGTVHGFLGPNGAGKSTTIRAIVGLNRVQGRIKVFGHSIPDELPQVVHRMGAIVERPRFPGEFSGRRNLLHLAVSLGLPRTAVDRVLDTVDLTSQANTRYGAYSLGMKQRLAIAAALLTEPDLVILDEPTNGLDPAGIQHMRGLTRRLAEEGRTVLISSHLLSEVQQMVDEVTIVNAGRTVAAGPLEALAGDRRRWRLVLAAHDHSAPQAAGLLRQHGWEVAAEPGALLVGGDEPGHAITRTLATANLWVESLTPERTGLEETFLSLTAPGIRPGELPPQPVRTAANHRHGEWR